MMNSREQRQKLRKKYRQLFKRVSEILFSEDPVGINFEENTDEYEPEVGTILPRLKECRTVDDVRRVTHREFVRWFDHATAGPEEHYQRIAELIWDELSRADKVSD